EEPEEAQEQHEDIEATTQTRVIAGVVDTVLVGALQGVFMLGTHFIVGQAIDSIYTNMEALLLVGSIDLGTLFLLSLFYAVYFIGGWGRTPGLRAAGLVVVDLNDQPVGYMQAVLRYFGTLAALLPAGLGQILTLIGKQGRGLGDRLAGTKVIFRASL
ncbi:MAG: RDD family protein, partial [bacterium]